MQPEPFTALNVMVKEIERLTGSVGFEPEGNFAKLDSQWIEVNAVDALADDIANGGTKSRRRRLFFAGADDGQFGGKP